MSPHPAILLSALLAAMIPAGAQTPQPAPAREQLVIDVHLHSGPRADLGRRIDELDRHHVVLGIVSGALADAEAWAAAQPSRLWAGVLFPCPGGAVPNGEAIETARFLSPDERRDILYNNAARFFRLDRSAVKP